jgi:hypothetical protein
MSSPYPFQGSLGMNISYGNNHSDRDYPDEDDIKHVDRLYQKTKILCGRSHLELADSVAAKIGIPLTKVKVTDFGNTEIGVEISESVRGYHVFIIQTGGNYEGTEYSH